MQSFVRTRKTALLAILALGLALPLSGQTVVRPSDEFSGSSAASRPAIDRLQPGVDFVPGQVLVTFKPTASATGRVNAVRSLGDQMGKALEGRPQMAAVKVQSGRTVRKAIQAYEADPRVAHAQPNFIYHALKTPNDPDFGQLWGLENTGQSVDGTTGSSGNDIGATGAWDARTDCSSVPVAVLDTGINHEHADLAGNMWGGDSNHGKDFVDGNDSDPIPNGGATHGTHVAGTIAAIGDNGTGTTGVCWNAEIMAVRVLGPDGSGTTGDIIEGIDYAVSQGAKVINMSLGFNCDPSQPDCPDSAMQSSIQNARSQGVLVVTAAGNNDTDNDSGTRSYPCSYSIDNIICVAALDQNYDLATFSNYGQSTVDLGAPGDNILSSFPGPAETAAFGTWTKNTEWAADTSCLVNSDLVNPSDWCSTGSYGTNLDSRAYQTFDLTGISLGAGYNFYYDVALNDSGDSFEAGHFAGSGDPFANSPTIDAQATGAFDSGYFGVWETGLTDCLGGQCSIGFRLTSDGSGSDTGSAIWAFRVRKVTSGATQREILNGTSMAAPHVSGIAALAWAYDSGGTYTEIRDAVRQGGDSVTSLSNNTDTGREADAFGTLAQLSQPPSIGNINFSTDEGSTGSVTISATDPEGDPISWSITSAPSHGSASIDSSGTATYDPDAGYTGSDSFTVEAADVFGNSDTATVSVVVDSTSGGGGGGGGGGGCTLSATPGQPDPIWLLMLAVPWFLRRYVVTGKH